MLTFSLSSVVSFILIVLIGLLTWFTDIKHRKIRNDHLVVVSCAAIGMIVIRWWLGDTIFIKTQLLSIICAITISGIFYVNNLWRGGDAKLFALYAILMPPTGYDSKMFVPAIVLFVNTFIIALIYLCFLAIIGNCCQPNVLNRKIYKFLLNQKTYEDYKSFILNILKLRVWKEFVRATWCTLCISWLLFPIFEIIGIAHHKSLSFLIVYLTNLTVFRRLEEFSRNVYLIAGILILGLALRASYYPDILSGINLLHYLKTVITYSAMSLAMYNITKGIHSSDTRVAFAPFLFVGCLLSYTPFLAFIISLQKAMKF